MDQKQPLEVIGNDLVSIQMIPGQKEQKLSKKAKNSQLAITLSSSSEMNSFFVTNDNFCMQKQWPVQKNKLNFFAQKKLDFLVPLLLKTQMEIWYHIEMEKRHDLQKKKNSKELFFNIFNLCIS